MILSKAVVIFVIIGKESQLHESIMRGREIQTIVHVVVTTEEACQNA